LRRRVFGGGHHVCEDVTRFSPRHLPLDPHSYFGGICTLKPVIPTPTHQTDKRQSGHTNIAEVNGNEVSFVPGAWQTLGLEYILNIGNLHLQPMIRR
jgi:hypothetical protein